MPENLKVLASVIVKPPKLIYLTLTASLGLSSHSSRLHETALKKVTKLKMKTILVCMCSHPSDPNKSRQTHSEFHSFYYNFFAMGLWFYLSKDWQNPQSILNLILFCFLCVCVQCFRSRSSWIRIRFGPGSGIRIRIWNPDPDSWSRCLKIGLKSQNLLWLTVF